MIYLFLAAFVVSFFAVLWMAKRLGDAGAYKQAVLIVILGTLGWCMPLFIQVFVLATFGTIAVQWWEDTKPALITWVVAVVAMFALSYSAGGTQGMLAELVRNDVPESAKTDVGVDEPNASTTE